MKAAVFNQQNSRNLRESALEALSPDTQSEKLDNKQNATTFVRADGSLRPIVQGANAMREDGTCAGTSSSSSSESFLVHLENSPLGLIEWNIDCQITKWSKRAEKIFGRRAEEVEGISFFDFRFIHEDDLERIRDVVVSLKVGDQIVGTAKNRNYTKDGSIVYCSWHNSSYPRGDDSQFVVTSLVLDETESFANAELLKRQNERLEFTLAAAEMGIWDVDLSTENVVWLGCMETLMGYEPGEFPGTLDAALKFISPEFGEFQSPVAVCKSVQAAGGNFEKTIRVSSPATDCKGERWVSIKGQVTYDLSGNPLRMSGTAVDVTGMRKNEEELISAKLGADHANALKSAFLANMSHEIRTPLGVILGFSELLADAELASDERVEFAGTISRNGRHLSRLIDDILDLSKVEAGRLEIFRTEVDVENVSAEILENHSDRAAAKNVKLLLDISREVPIQVSTDIVRFKQIVSNLVGNALKFTANGEICLAVTSQTLEQKLMLKVVVLDTGIGISTEGQQNLFEPFVQADRARTRKFGGTGLGLALSRRLARALGGDIILSQSVPDQGSTFEFTHLALMSTAPAETVRRKTSVNDGPARAGLGLRAEPRELVIHEPLQGIRILLAEDTPDNQILMDRIIRKRGAQIAIAGDGEEVVALAMSGDFDVVLMDIQMPKIDGYEATRRLRNAGYSKPIVALTAHAMKGESHRCIEAGCNVHLSKPVRPDELVETILRMTTSESVHVHDMIHQL